MVGPGLDVDHLRFGAFTIDVPGRRLACDGAPVRGLQGQAFDVLAYLARRPGEIVTKATLKEEFWPASATDDSVYAAISQIRKVLGAVSPDARGYVENVRGAGYRFRGTAAPKVPQRTAARAVLTCSFAAGVLGGLAVLVFMASWPVTLGGHVDKLACIRAASAPVVLLCGLGGLAMGVASLMIHTRPAWSTRISVSVAMCAFGGAVVWLAHVLGCPNHLREIGEAGILLDHRIGKYAAICLTGGLGSLLLVHRIDMAHRVSAFDVFWGATIPTVLCAVWFAAVKLIPATPSDLRSLMWPLGTLAYLLTFLAILGLRHALCRRVEWSCSTPTRP